MLILTIAIGVVLFSLLLYDIYREEVLYRQGVKLLKDMEALDEKRKK